MIFNLGGAVEGEASRFLQAELQTYRQVFPQVYLFKINSDYTDEQLQNLIIVASKNKNAATLTSTDAAMSKLLKHLHPKNIRPEIQLLTDDFAPVEYFNSFAQSTYRKKSEKK